MFPEEVLEYLGPWSGFFVAIAVIVLLVKLVFKDVFKGMKTVVEVADNVAAIPEIASSVAKIVNDIPALQKRLTELETEVVTIKGQLKMLVESGLLPREGELANVGDN